MKVMMMRIRLRLIACCLAWPAVANADPVSTFQQFCLAHAPDAAAIEQAVQKAGFVVSRLADTVFVAMRRQTDEAVQVNVASDHAFECAVTTSSEGAPEATGARFFAALNLQGKDNAARGTLRGTRYHFRYDPNGGEAFVMWAE